jgi:hypothetical protein
MTSINNRKIDEKIFNESSDRDFNKFQKYPVKDSNNNSLCNYKMVTYNKYKLFKKLLEH